MPDGPKVTPPVEPPEQLNSSSVFTDVQREALIDEIVNEMRKDSIKEDASTRLQKARRVVKAMNQPAALLVLSFVFTGLISGLIANRWQRNESERQAKAQRKEWDRQQLRLFGFHGVDLKYKLIDDLTKSIGERHAAAKAIVIPLVTESSDQELIAEEVEPKMNWQKVQLAWRADSQILLLRIETLVKTQYVAEIKDKSAAEIFKRIITTETEIGSKTTIAKDELRKYHRGHENDLSEIVALIEKTELDLRDLVTVIAADAERAVQTNLAADEDR